MTDSTESRSTVPESILPDWATEVLACPRCRGSLVLDGDRFVCAPCGPVGSFEGGVARFRVDHSDAGTVLYEKVEGPRLFERMQVPYTTSSLDAPVYAAYMQALRPLPAGALLLDAGAGDGRNTMAWLDDASVRVVATDAVLAPLLRIRDRASSEGQSLDRLLLVQSDVRSQPLRDDCCDVVLALEVLCLLGEAYEAGVGECARLLSPGGQLLLSDYSAEGALMSKLLYEGVSGMLEVARTRSLPHRHPDVTAHARILDEAELASIIEATGLVVEERKGISALSPLLGYLKGKGEIGEADEKLFEEVSSLLERLGSSGRMRRAEVMLARKPNS